MRKNGLEFLFILCVILTLVITSAYADAEKMVDAPSVSDTHSLSNISDKLILIGVLANRGPEIALKEWGPTADYLSRELSPLQFTIVPLDFQEIIKIVENQEVSFVCANPSVYTYMEYYGHATRIATLQVPGDPYPQALFGGVIFTRSDRNDIQDLSDLRGKTFVAVDETSLGGWQAALAEMRAADIDPERDFSALNFTGTHDAAITAVLHGQADAGTARSTQLERMAKEGSINLSDIKILNDKHSQYPTYPYLLSTDLYPEWPFAAVTGTDLDLSKKVSVALLMMEEDDPAAKAVRGAGWAIPQDHTTVHELLRRLNLPPYEMWGKSTPQEVLNQYWLTILGIVLGILILSLLLLYTWKTKKSLALALVQVKESEFAIKQSKEKLELVNAELEETQGRIMDSIHYAKLIQNSILPSERELHTYLKDHFSIIKPLDIVGGDFYLFKETKDGFCIAVVDCTGHGVPGAFMTMMANALLDRVIETNPDDTPASLLEKLHFLVQETLKSQSDSEHLENGLDIALCRVYSDTSHLLFAGAGLALCIAEGTSVREILGDRLHIGFSQTRKTVTFTDNSVNIIPDTRYYLVTDGVLDLPGGTSGYGFGKKRLISLLSSLSSLSMQEQKEQLLDSLKLYQGDYIQKDDLTIIGFIVR